MHYGERVAAAATTATTHISGGGLRNCNRFRLR